MFSKHFTPKEANKRLPYVKKIVGEILIKGKRLRELLKHNEGQDISFERDTFQLQIENLMDELEEMGCFYKDWNFEVGLVDFPAVIEEEEVLLCWKSDEREILWYHGVEDGFAGRRPIPEQWLFDMNDVFKDS